MAVNHTQRHRTAGEQSKTANNQNTNQTTGFKLIHLPYFQYYQVKEYLLTEEEESSFMPKWWLKGDFHYQINRKCA